MLCRLSNATRIFAAEQEETSLTRYLAKRFGLPSGYAQVIDDYGDDGG
jgi:hypothetical protein